MTRLDDLKGQLAQLDDLIRSGALKGKAAKQARDKLEAQLLAAVVPGSAGPASGGHPGGNADGGDAAAAVRPSARLLLGSLVFVLAFGVAGYAWLGNWQALAVAPGAPAVAVAGAGAASHDMDQAQFEALTQKLADRLKSEPEDAEGWSMLGRSYVVLERYPQALEAYKRLIALRPKDAQALVDYADAIGMANGRKLDGEPEKLIQQALVLEPNNTKALALAGTVAFSRGDSTLAAQLWQRAVAQLGPDSEMARQLQSAIDEARQRAGLPPLPAASMPALATASGAAPAAAARPVAAAASGASVQVRITLAPALAAQARPDDTLFVFARAVQGPKAPLAIQRRQVKDLPLEVTLDESMAMSPALSLSSVSQVVVGARISKSGNAMPQPGDLQGLSPGVAVGAKGVLIEIGEVVR